jgi:hypothetical protein
MRSVVALIGFSGFVAYCITWLIVAVASNPTWWWFVPIYGDIRIFQASVWWGLFHLSSLPAMFLAALLIGE